MPPSLELPKPPADLHAARKGDKVTLTWTIPARTTDRQRVRYLGATNICRGAVAILKECGTAIGGVAAPADFAHRPSRDAKMPSSYVDTLPSSLEQADPRGSVTYAVSVENTDRRAAGLSNQVHVALVPTLAPFADLTATVGASGIALSWKCPASAEGVRGVKYLFRIYRRLESESKDGKLTEVQATDCANSQPAPPAEDSYLDQNFEWEKTYVYHGAVVSVIGVPGKNAVEVEGDDTPAITAFAHDVFPPAVPSGLQAVFSGPGQSPFIDLIWTPDTDADLDGYTVYRREEGGAEVKLNPAPVKTPAYRDTQVEPGKTYFYSVSAVDARSNESARSQEASERVP